MIQLKVEGGNMILAFFSSREYDVFCQGFNIEILEFWWWFDKLNFKNKFYKQHGDWLLVLCSKKKILKEREKKFGPYSIRIKKKTRGTKHRNQRVFLNYSYSNSNSKLWTKFSSSMAFGLGISSLRHAYWHLGIHILYSH